MELRCKRYGSEEHTGNGFMRGKQRCRCKACGLSFTDKTTRGKPFALKLVAAPLYVSGPVRGSNPRMNRTAERVGVSTPTVQARLEQFAKAHAPKPEPQQGRVVAIEPDEMRLYWKKSQKPWSWKAWDRATGRPVDGEGGAVAIEPPASGC